MLDRVTFQLRSTHAGVFQRNAIQGQVINENTSWVNICAVPAMELGEVLTYFDSMSSFVRDFESFALSTVGYFDVNFRFIDAQTGSTTIFPAVRIHRNEYDNQWHYAFILCDDVPPSVSTTTRPQDNPSYTPVEDPDPVIITEPGADTSNLFHLRISADAPFSLRKYVYMDNYIQFASSNVSNVVDEYWDLDARVPPLAGTYGVLATPGNGVNLEYTVVFADGRGIESSVFCKGGLSVNKYYSASDATEILSKVPIIGPVIDVAKGTPDEPFLKDVLTKGLTVLAILIASIGGLWALSTWRKR